MDKVRKKVQNDTQFLLGHVIDVKPLNVARRGLYGLIDKAKADFLKKMYPKGTKSTKRYSIVHDK